MQAVDGLGRGAGEDVGGAQDAVGDAGGQGAEQGAFAQADPVMDGVEQWGQVLVEQAAAELFQQRVLVGDHADLREAADGERVAGQDGDRDVARRPRVTRGRGSSKCSSTTSEPVSSGTRRADAQPSTAGRASQYVYAFHASAAAACGCAAHLWPARSSGLSNWPVGQGSPRAASRWGSGTRRSGARPGISVLVPNITRSVAVTGANAPSSIRRSPYHPPIVSYPQIDSLQ